MVGNDNHVKVGVCVCQRNVDDDDDDDDDAFAFVCEKSEIVNSSKITSTDGSTIKIRKIENEKKTKRKYMVEKSERLRYTYTGCTKPTNNITKPRAEQ